MFLKYYNMLYYHKIINWFQRYISFCSKKSNYIDLDIFVWSWSPNDLRHSPHDWTCLKALKVNLSKLIEKCALCVFIYMISNVHKTNIDQNVTVVINLIIDHTYIYWMPWNFICYMPMLGMRLNRTCQIE